MDDTVLSGDDGSDNDKYALSGDDGSDKDKYAFQLPDDERRHTDDVINADVQKFSQMRNIVPFISTYTICQLNMII